MRTFSFRDEVENSPPPSSRKPSRRSHSSQCGPNWWFRIFVNVRSILIFLLLAAIATFVLAHLNEINDIALAKAHLVENHIQKLSDHDSLRQNALKYEKEVDSAATGKKP